MSQESQYIICPTIEEIVAASAPGVAEDYRATIKKRLEACAPVDDVTAGAINFLKDHNYDFDALHHFLEVPISFSTFNKKHSSNINYITVLSLASCLILVLGGVWLLFYKPQPEKIISQSIFYEPGLPVFASMNGKKEFNELMSAFRMQDAKTGLGYYRTLSKENALNDTLNYFGGWLYYQNKQPDSAALVFGQVVVSKSENYLQKAQFMQAICIYLSGNKTEAKKLFENITSDKLNFYNEKSLELLTNKTLW